MESVHTPCDPLADPPGRLQTLLTNFFDPNHTLLSLATSLGLTIEGLINYLALPEVAAALDQAEALFLHRAALHAAAALESVHSQLQSLPPRAARPSRASTARHRRKPRVSPRRADLPREPRAPSHATSPAPAADSPSPEPTTPRQDSAPHCDRTSLPASNSQDSRPLRAHPTTLVTPRDSAASPRPAVSNTTSIALKHRRALNLMAAREPTLGRQVPTFRGTHLNYCQSG